MLPARIHALSPSETLLDQTRKLCLIKLYKSIGGTFINLWSGIQRQADPSWVHELQMELVELMPDYFQGTEERTIDVMLTHYWLRTIVWRPYSS